MTRPLYRANSATLDSILSQPCICIYARCISRMLVCVWVPHAAVQALHARFKTAARGVCRRLREAAADTGGALGGVSPAHAAALLGQLDYNGFYLGMD